MIALGVASGLGLLVLLMVRESDRVGRPSVRARHAAPVPRRLLPVPFALDLLLAGVSAAVLFPRLWDLLT